MWLLFLRIVSGVAICVRGAKWSWLLRPENNRSHRRQCRESERISIAKIWFQFSFIGHEAISGNGGNKLGRNDWHTNHDYSVSTSSWLVSRWRNINPHASRANMVAQKSNWSNLQTIFLTMSLFGLMLNNFNAIRWSVWPDHQRKRLRVTHWACRNFRPVYSIWTLSDSMQGWRLDDYMTQIGIRMEVNIRRRFWKYV